MCHTSECVGKMTTTKIEHPLASHSQFTDNFSDTLKLDNWCKILGEKKQQEKPNFYPKINRVGNIITLWTRSRLVLKIWRFPFLFVICKPSKIQRYWLFQLSEFGNENEMRKSYKMIDKWIPKKKWINK